MAGKTRAITTDCALSGIGVTGALVLLPAWTGWLAFALAVVGTLSAAFGIEERRLIRKLERLEAERRGRLESPRGE